MFPNRKEAKEWAAPMESAIGENRYFPHAAAKRTSFDALATDYVSTVLAEFDPKERATRERQLNWSSEQFSGLSLADITPDRLSQARDKLAAETFTKGKPRKGSQDRRGGSSQGIQALWRNGKSLYRMPVRRALIRDESAPANRSKPCQ